MSDFTLAEIKRLCAVQDFFSDFNDTAVAARVLFRLADPEFARCFAGAADAGGRHSCGAED